MSAAWRGDRIVHGRPFGAKAQRWLQDRLECQVREMDPFGPVTLTADLKAQLVIWYKTRATRFVCWKPYDECARRQATGRWQFREKEFGRFWVNAVAWAQAEVSNAEDAKKFQCASLSQWLEAERRGELKGPGVEGGTPRVTEAQERALNDAMWHRLRHWPRNCRDCGDTFRPLKNGAARCAQCLTAFRSERAAKSPKPHRPQAPELPVKVVAPAESFEQARLRGRLDVAESAFDRLNEELRLLYELRRQNRGVNDGDAR